MFIIKTYFGYVEISSTALDVFVYIFLGFVALFWINTGIDFFVGKPNLISSIVLGTKFKPYHLLIISFQLILPVMLFIKSLARKYIGVLLVMFLFNLPYYTLTLILGVSQTYTDYNPDTNFNWVLDFPSFGLKDLGIGFFYAMILLGILKTIKN
jgi:hypothetical protein